MTHRSQKCTVQCLVCSVGCCLPWPGPQSLKPVSCPEQKMGILSKPNCQVGDMAVYRVGSSSKCVIWCYDIYGFRVRLRHVLLLILFLLLPLLRFPCCSSLCSFFFSFSFSCSFSFSFFFSFNHPLREAVPGSSVTNCLTVVTWSGQAAYWDTDNIKEINKEKEFLFESLK